MDYEKLKVPIGVLIILLFIIAALFLISSSGCFNSPENETINETNETGDVAPPKPDPEPSNGTENRTENEKPVIQVIPTIGGRSTSDSASIIGFWRVKTIVFEETPDSFHQGQIIAVYPNNLWARNEYDTPMWAWRQSGSDYIFTVGEGEGSFDITAKLNDDCELEFDPYDDSPENPVTTLVMEETLPEDWYVDSLEAMVEIPDTGEISIGEGNIVMDPNYFTFDVDIYFDPSDFSGKLGLKKSVEGEDPDGIVEYGGTWAVNKSTRNSGDFILTVSEGSSAGNYNVKLECDISNENPWSLVFEEHKFTTPGEYKFDVDEFILKLKFPEPE
ncbi:hypothetical protein [Methanolapillus ohkumae]|uniref:Uncharacterized protein n=1 Tax=Methanolapillus ohkumae TaxID=3028298 RepID=A0AA96ZXY8_9EURY|nr:hypothetical protein MsAm2_13790 [Methanosarcinaceae archaeon Am2]